jgi:uncharacterized glyoxalase superfamily protein PhnB
MTARLFAYLSYRDAPAALAWLRGCGFEIVRRIDGEDGRVLHAEARLDDAVVIVASNDEEEHAVLVRRSTGHGIYLMVNDVDGLYERAVAGGATPEVAPEYTEWMTRHARVLDLEGIEWTFGSYEPAALR